jgi:hypothetical protein
MSTRLTVLAVLATLLVTFLPAGALAQEEGGDDGTTTTMVVDDGGAAVPAPPAEEADTSQPWTARYLPPTLVALTVLLVGGLTLFYFFGIRRKYVVG